MGIRFFNIEIDRLGSVLCAITSVTLVVAAIWALLEIGEYVITNILSFF